MRLEINKKIFMHFFLEEFYEVKKNGMKKTELLTQNTALQLLLSGRTIHFIGALSKISRSDALTA